MNFWDKFLWNNDFFVKIEAVSWKYIQKGICLKEFERTYMKKEDTHYDK